VKLTFSNSRRISAVDPNRNSGDRALRFPIALLRSQETLDFFSVLSITGSLKRDLIDAATSRPQR
jgi:hypothetical protein